MWTRVEKEGAARACAGSGDEPSSVRRARRAGSSVPLGLHRSSSSRTPGENHSARFSLVPWSRRHGRAWRWRRPRGWTCPQEAPAASAPGPRRPTRCASAPRRHPARSAPRRTDVYCWEPRALGRRSDPRGTPRGAGGALGSLSGVRVGRGEGEGMERGGGSGWTNDEKVSSIPAP